MENCIYCKYEEWYEPPCDSCTDDCDEYESIIEEDFGDVFPDSTIDIEMFDEEN